MADNLSSNKNSDTYWQDMILHKIASFLPEVDRDLQVSIENKTIYLNEGGSREGTVLHFYHKTNSSIEWTMDMKKDEDYIEHQLEQVVKKIYAEKKGSN